jgi:AraC-like DNA-binding protein
VDSNPDKSGENQIRSRSVQARAQCHKDHHFKSVSSMSPLQFQKHLHLQEARRLMSGEDMDAASAGFRVGYEDPSHFSREYKRHFGAAAVAGVPMRLRRSTVR